MSKYALPLSIVAALGAGALVALMLRAAVAKSNDAVALDEANHKLELAVDTIALLKKNLHEQQVENYTARKFADSLELEIRNKPAPVRTVFVSAPYDSNDIVSLRTALDQRTSALIQVTVERDDAIRVALEHKQQALDATAAFAAHLQQDSAQFVRNADLVRNVESNVDAAKKVTHRSTLSKIWGATKRVGTVVLPALAGYGFGRLTS